VSLKRRALLFNHTNLEDYADPILFDLENSDFEPDGPFYLSFAQQIGEPVLELRCDTGRITILLAQNWIDITGIDIEPVMLSRASGKARDLSISSVRTSTMQLRLSKP
jgi:SAM-dependent methyltransferase